MAKVKTFEIVKSLSGKICSHSEMSFVTNKKMGNTFTRKTCNPSTAEASEGQVNARKAFATRVKLASAWIKANKGSKLFDKVKSAYNAQSSGETLMGYVMRWRNIR